MGKYKICVYAICKNEEQFVDRWMDVVSEADLVVVTDTGSTDKTVEKLKSRGAIVYEESITPWRFDVARNVAMSHIPEDFDICVSNDLDEVFQKGWRTILEEKWDSSCTRARYMFTWSYFSDGTPDKQFIMEKIHRRKGFRWVHPVHEVLEYSGSDLEYSLFIPEIVLNHYPDLSKPRSQYLPLLELSAQENPEDDRTIFWLGREYYYYKQYDDCIKTLIHHLTLKNATWDEERSASMRFIASSYKEKGHIVEAKSWLYRAIAECSYVREPYMAMIRLGYETSDWSLVYLMANLGLRVTEKTGSYLLEPEGWGYLMDDYAAIACYQLGMYEKAYAHALKALKMAPTDCRLKENLELITQKLDENGVGKNETI